MIGGNLITRGLVGARVVGGTWTASRTWTIPAVTLGGAVTGGGQAISNLASVSLVGYGSFGGVTDDAGIRYLGGINQVSGAEIILWGKTAATGRMDFITPNAAYDAEITRLSINGGVATAVATWSNVNIDFGAGYTSYTEMTAPGVGAANTARVYAVVGVDTLTDLAAVFQDGTVDIFAQEATPPDSPIFEFPDNTEIKTIMRKPDRKTIQFVSQFPDGREFIMREIQYPTERWN